MSDRHNQLLLAALKRAGAERTSDILLDEALGLAGAELWPQHTLTALTRRSVSKRLQNLEDAGLVRKSGLAVDAAARRTTPAYVPTDGFDPKAPVPAPPEVVARPAGRSSDTSTLTKAQILKILDVQEDVIEAVQRFLTDIQGIRDRAKRELMAAGVWEG